MTTQTYTDKRKRSLDNQANAAFRFMILSGVCLVAAVMALITYGPHLTGFVVVLAYIAAAVGWLVAAIGWYPDRRDPGLHACSARRR